MPELSFQDQDHSGSFIVSVDGKETFLLSRSPASITIWKLNVMGNGFMYLDQMIDIVSDMEEAREVIERLVGTDIIITGFDYKSYPEDL